MLNWYKKERLWIVISGSCTVLCGLLIHRFFSETMKSVLKSSAKANWGRLHVHHHHKERASLLSCKNTRLSTLETFCHISEILVRFDICNCLIYPLLKLLLPRMDEAKYFGVWTASCWQRLEVLKLTPKYGASMCSAFLEEIIVRREKVLPA